MQKQPSFQNPRSCESNKPIVLFVIACLILVSSLVMLALTAWDFYDSTQPPAESVESGFAILGGILAAVANLFFGVIAMLFFAMYWGVGMLVSAHLAYNKQEIPHRLRIGAHVLTAVFEVLIIGALGIVAYVTVLLFL